MVKLVKTIDELRSWISETRAAKCEDKADPTAPSIAFVPTLGALHGGHLSLVNECLRRWPRVAVVVSIFVNPLQFEADGRDLGQYPRTLDSDLKLLDGRAEVVFAPEVAELYAEEAGAEIRVRAGHKSPAQYEVRDSERHFDGVLTVVAKLFNIVTPDVAAFGQKDAEQVFLISQMVRQLNFNTRILAVPTARDSDGVAMSSRNRQLSSTERTIAARLPAVLFAIRDSVAGDAKLSDRLSHGLRVLEDDSDIRLEYLVAVDPITMLEVEDGHRGRALLMLAAWVGETRLIDNVEISIS